MSILDDYQAIATSPQANTPDGQSALNNIKSQVNSDYKALTSDPTFKTNTDAQQIAHRMRASGIVDDPTQGGLIPPAPSASQSTPQTPVSQPSPEAKQASQNLQISAQLGTSLSQKLAAFRASHPGQPDDPSLVSAINSRNQLTKQHEDEVNAANLKMPVSLYRQRIAAAQAAQANPKGDTPIDPKDLDWSNPISDAVLGNKDVANSGNAHDRALNGILPTLATAFSVAPGIKQAVEADQSLDTGLSKMEVDQARQAVAQAKTPAQRAAANQRLADANVRWSAAQKAEADTLARQQAAPEAASLFMVPGAGAGSSIEEQVAPLFKGVTEGIASVAAKGAVEGTQNAAQHLAEADHLVPQGQKYNAGHIAEADHIASTAPEPTIGSISPNIESKGTAPRIPPAPGHVPVLAKPDEYYAKITDENGITAYHKVDGQPVQIPNHPNIDAFAYPNGAKWEVGEGMNGATLGTGDSAAEAVQNAGARLEPYSPEAVSVQQGRSAMAGGVSPRYEWKPREEVAPNISEPTPDVATNEPVAEPAQTAENTASAPVSEPQAVSGPTETPKPSEAPTGDVATIAKALESSDGNMALPDIVKATGLPKDTVPDALDAGQKSGHITWSDEGGYKSNGPITDTVSAIPKVSKAAAKKAQQAADSQLMSDAFAPGNVVRSDYWGTPSKIMDYDPKTGMATGIRVNEDGSAIPGEQPRTWLADIKDAKAWQKDQAASSTQAPEGQASGAINQGTIGEAPYRRPNTPSKMVMPPEEQKWWDGNHWMKEDAVPFVKHMQDVVSNVKKEIVRALSPANLSDQAALTARILRSKNAELALKDAQAYHATKQWIREFDKMPQESQVAFIDNMEKGLPQRNPELQPVADMLRKILDQGAEDWKNLDPLKMREFIENYFPHMWKDPKIAQEQIGKYLTNRSLEGSASFLKQRTLPTFQDGLDLGLEPVTYNPIEATLMKYHEVQRYIMGQKAWEEMKQYGLSKYVRIGGEVPAGFERVKDGIGTAYGGTHVPVSEAVDAQRMNSLAQAASDLGIDVSRIAKMKGGKFGEYDPESKSITTRFGGDEQVLIHEIGHALDDKYEIGKVLMRGDKATQDTVRKELNDLADLRFEGQNVPKSYQKYVRKVPERTANALTAYLYAPDKMAEVAPTVQKRLQEFMQDHDELRNLVGIKPSLVLGKQTANVPVGGLILHGHWYQPHEAADVFNNFLSPGISSKAGYQFFRGITNLTNMVQLGLSGFHLTFTTLDSIASTLGLGLRQLSGLDADGFKTLLSSPVAPAKTFIAGKELRNAALDPESASPQMQAMTKALTASGGRVNMDKFYQTDLTRNMVKAWDMGNKTGALLRLAPSIVEAPSKMLMSEVVPNMKLGIFSDMAKATIKRLGPDATEDELREALAKDWDSVENRMGMLTYDNLFWNRTLKDVSQLLIRSVGWNLGTLRELGGGLTDLSPKQISQRIRQGDPALTHRMSYLISLPVTVGTAGAIYNAVHTGQYPQSLQDYFMPRTGRTNPDGTPERVMFPTYMKDILPLVSAAESGGARGLAGRAVQMGANKLTSPISQFYNMAVNRDYYGDQIYNEDDPLVQQAKDGVAEYLKSNTPLSIQNFQKMSANGGDASRLAESFFGILPASKELTNTPAMNLLRQKLDAMRPQGSRTQADAAAEQTRMQLRKDIAAGKDYSQELQDAIRTHAITSEQQGSKLIRGAKDPYIVYGVGRLPIDSAIDVWKKMSPQEQQQTKDIMSTKAEAAIDKLGDDTQAVSALKLKLKAAGVK